MREPYIISRPEAEDGKRFWHEAVNVTQTVGWIALFLYSAATGYELAKTYDAPPPHYSGNIYHREQDVLGHYIAKSAEPLLGDAVSVAMVGFSGYGRRQEARYADVIMQYHGTMRPIEKE